VRIEELKKIKDQRPFQPFRIRLTDGREIEIKHPDAVAWDVDEKRIVLAISKGEHYWLDIALVTALVEPVPAGPIIPYPEP
jgi:hypothetical protein